MDLLNVSALLRLPRGYSSDIKTMTHPSEWSLVICGGGSGGHLFPALAVVEELKRWQHPPGRIVFLTAERSIDRFVLQREGVEQIALPAVGSHDMRRHPIRATGSLWQATWQARKILKSLPQPVILGTGGFSSVPGILAARWRKCPVVLLEQNVIPGRATSMLARFARHVCLSFEETRRLLPEQISMNFTGNPVRQTIATMKPTAVTTKKRVLVLGGSQGAHAVNDGALRFANQHRELLAGWTIIHQTGESDAARVKQAYQEMKQKAQVAPFFENMPELYSKASFVVTRAGGTSLAEIACAGLPAIIIPYPRSLRNHQLINARHFVGLTAAFMIEQSPLTAFDLELARTMTLLITDKILRTEMANAMRSSATPDAATRVCELLLPLHPGQPPSA